MRTFLKFPTTSQGHKRLGIAAMLGILAVTILILVWLTPLKLMHVITTMVVATCLYFSPRIVRAVRKLRAAHKIRKREATQLTYIPREELSSITVEHSGLSEDELNRVLYDAPHHWVVTLAMVINPFWSQDHDLQPQVSSDFVAAQSGLGNKFLTGIVRRGTRVAQVVYVALLVMVALWLSLRHFSLIDAVPSTINNVMVFTTVMLTGATIIWVIYVIKLSQGCRLIVTDSTIFLLVHQLPYRDNTRAFVPYTLYASNNPQQSLAGKILGYMDFSFSTVDPKEPLSGWVKARNPQKLKAILENWDARKRDEQRQKHLELTAKRSRVAEPDDTQEIPVVHL